MGLTLYLCATGAVVVGLYIIRRLRVYQWGQCKSTASMIGKVVVVTGANSGLGRETALDLARRGAAVVMACRDLKRGQEAELYIRQHTDQGQLVLMRLDLADFDSIKQFSREFSERFQKLDVLVNNAGVMYPVEAHMRTAQDYEIHFGVNHLGVYMLTGLLLERLQAAAASRVVILSSNLYTGGRIDLANIATGQNLQPGRRVNPAYVNSKLCNALFGRQLASVLAGTGVHVYTVCPGWVYTGLFRNNGLGWGALAILPIAFLFMRTVRQGVQTQLECAVSPQLADESGHMYANVRRAKYAPVACDEEAQRGLWQLSAALTGVSFHATELEQAQKESM